MPQAHERNTGTTVADVMIREPKLCDGTATVGEVRQLFTDDHVHAVLLVRNARLLTVIERSDIPPCAPHTAPAHVLGRLRGRVITGTDSLARASQQMRATGQRRLAVIDGDGVLLGLLCLKRSRAGFCTEQDIRDRAADRGAQPAAGRAQPGLDHPRLPSRDIRVAAGAVIDELSGLA